MQFKRKHVANVTFSLKRCGKDDAYLFLNINNFLPEYLK
jgi:hypothetical protein